MADITTLAANLKNGTITGHDLSTMVTNNEITKGERRKIVKLSTNTKAEVELSERQKLRLAVKEKKAMPKLTKDDRKRKFQKDFEEERDKEAANFTVCLGCRKRGHFLKDCPKAVVTCVSSEKEVCFNCGSNEHTLKNCTVPREYGSRLKFATCFICKQVGHISRDCTENANGLYVNGGCCHICLQKTHLVKDCPQRTEEDKEAFLARKAAKDDEATNGVRVKGLTVSSDSMRGDELALDYDEAASDGDDDDDRHAHKKKSKKSKKSNK